MTPSQIRSIECDPNYSPQYQLGFSAGLNAAAELAQHAVAECERRIEELEGRLAQLRIDASYANFE